MENNFFYSILNILDVCCDFCANFFNVAFIQLDAPSPWGIYFQDSATPAKRFGKSHILRVKFSNSGDPLKLLVPNENRKMLCGWINYLCEVISQKITKKGMGNRGSKLVTSLNNVTVKEQRVNGNFHVIYTPCLRYTLTGFERNSQIRILLLAPLLENGSDERGNQTINKLRSYTSLAAPDSLKQDFKMNPGFFTGFTDAEGCFTISIVRNKEHKVGWAVKIRFKISLHQKDKALLEQIKNYFCAGNVHKRGPQSLQFRIDSVKDLKIVIDHFDKYPLICQKFADYKLFKQAFSVILNKEHLGSPTKGRFAPPLLSIIKDASLGV